MTTQSPLRYRDQMNNIVRLGERIGGGGEGDVFAVIGQPGSAAKIWKRGGDADKSARKVQIMSQRPASRQAENGYTIAWPQDLLYEDGTQRRIVGYTMRRIPGEWENIIDYCSPVAAQKLAHTRGQDITAIRRRRIAYNLCRAVNAIHQSGYVIGDINDQNIMVSRNGEIAVIDCDSFQVEDDRGEKLTTDRVRQEFQPPEIQRLNTSRDVPRDYDHDAFALAVLLFKLLCEGQHPYDCLTANNDQYQNHPPRIRDGISPFHGERATPQWKNAWNQLEEPIKDRFIHTFTAVDPRSRTKPEQWIEVFAQPRANARKTDSRFKASTNPQGKPGGSARQPNQQRYTVQGAQGSSWQERAQLEQTEYHTLVEAFASALNLSVVIQSAILLAITSLAAGIALLIPQSRAWLSDTLGYGWVSAGAFVFITPLFLSMLRTNAQHWGWRLWLASAVVATISVIAMALIDGGSGYGVSGLWGHSLTGGGKPFIAATELFIAIEVLIPLLITDANAAMKTMVAVAVLTFLALSVWIAYIIVMWVIANFVAILSAVLILTMMAVIAFVIFSKK